MLRAVVAGCVLASALVASARWFWLGEVAASFAFHLGLAIGLVAVVLASTRRFVSALALSALALWHAGPELALSWPRPRDAAPSAASLRLASTNILWGNGERDDLLAWYRAEAADVVVVVEVSPAWQRELAGFDLYPHQLWSPPLGTWEPDTFGTAILSRTPFVATRLVPVRSGTSRPLLEASVAFGNGTLTVRGAHTMRPGKAWRIERRNEVLALAAGLDWSGASLFAGDLNVVSTSPAFRDLLERSGLRDSRRGFGRQPTYTIDDPLPGPAIAIDHVLTSRDLVVRARRTPLLPGSDHRAVVVDLAAAAPR
jgi:endonuclease/exonuclease/phosphatase (EEP) superfamily protein YafD